ncbi:MAG: 7TM diverse intracellular signaling domain-containing protein [Sulfurimonas sp.]|uniref:7TM diverse intracellular signaling domain-containing protein n=1 Tax=Sulfurimonas sp. TaxID=2022749 RepID=UPI00260DF138|nr:7TM diverse intracellular signaling domain-containing protein [Sulfurimonas sp.]MDD2651483.1 7TM diverse intracellular signaling domain-containing protein [Sulfurimonas sp.]MDD3451024.1 7TM diverse intracellular signaling domain-containing protein [Sulfurimonas sp.]
MQLIFLFFLLTLSTDAKTIDIYQSDTDISLLEHSELYIDKGAKQSCDSLCPSPELFAPFAHSYINNGYTTDEAVWVRFTLKNNSQKPMERVLHIDNSIADSVILYAPDSLPLYSGILFRPEFDGILDFYFPLTLPPNIEQTYYLRVLSNSCSTNFHLNLETKDILWKKSLTHQLILMAALSLLATLIVYNLFLFLFTHEKIYLYYVAATFFITYNHLSYTGMNLHLFGLFFPLKEFADINRIDAYFGIYYIGFAIIFTLLFVREFMSISAFVKIDWMIKGQMAVAVVLMALSSGSFYLLEQLIYMGLFATAFILCTAIYLFIKKHENSIYFLVGWGVNALGQFFFLLYNMGVYLSDGNYWYFYEISITFEALLFSVVLAKKLNRAKALASALDTQKILIKELHHRVKNNLQFIVSLYRLKLKKHLTNEGRILLKEAEQNIRSIGKIHEILYARQNLSHLDASLYFGDLVQEIQKSFTTQNIAISIEGEAHIKIEQALYCGIIINELVTNALKYAFDATGGHIALSLGTNGIQNTLSVCDNGRGFDYEGCEHSFGLSLIRRLVEEELKGQMSVKTDNGSCFTIVWS